MQKGGTNFQMLRKAGEVKNDCNIFWWIFSEKQDAAQKERWKHSADAFFVCSTRKQRIETDFQDDKENSEGSIVMLTNFNDYDVDNYLRGWYFCNDNDDDEVGLKMFCKFHG